jgi:hypothetical protein
VQELFRSGGWGMYPTAIVGVLLVVAAIHRALFPERNTGPLLRRLAALTALVSVLGFVTGVVKTLTSLGKCPMYERRRSPRRSESASRSWSSRSRCSCSQSPQRCRA